VQQVVERANPYRCCSAGLTGSGSAPKRLRGWADAASMNKLRLADGTRFSYNAAIARAYANHRWETASRPDP